MGVGVVWEAEFESINPTTLLICDEGLQNAKNAQTCDQGQRHKIASFD